MAGGQARPVLVEASRARGVRLGRGHLYLALPAAALALAIAVSLTQGAAQIPTRTAITLALNALPGVSLHVDAPEAWQRIVVEIRLPRIIAAAMVGGALAVSGAAYQGVFRNPLAEPFLLGVAAGAALGASLAIVSPLPVDSYGFGWVPLFAFGGAGLTVVAVYFIARSGAAVDNASLILAGVALSAVWSAATSFILLTAGRQAQPIFAFLFGGLNTASWERVALGAPYIAAGSAVIALHARVLNVLQLDEEQAAHLGVNVARTKLVVLGAASLVAATSVAMAGIIGFVGLVVPHAVRLIYGGDYRRALPAAALLGAAFLVLVDLFARSVLAPQEVPVGIVTAVIGGPFFLALLRARRSRLVG